MVCEAECLGCYLILQVKSRRVRKLVELAKGPIRQNDAVSSQFDLHDKVRLVFCSSASCPPLTSTCNEQQQMKTIPAGASFQ